MQKHHRVVPHFVVIFVRKDKIKAPINNLKGFCNNVDPVRVAITLPVACIFQLLNRVFNIMREKNPDMVAGEKRKFVMKPPQVVRVGTKKTSFVNFTDICKL